MGTTLSIKPSIHITQCPLCDSAALASFARPDYHGVRLHYRICRRCGHVFMSPVFDEEALRVFYEEEYRVVHDGQADPTAKNIAQQDRRAAHLAQVVKDNIPAIGSHLDIGCSSGALLHGIQMVFPAVSSVGIEPSKAHRALGQEGGYTIYASLEDVLAAEPGTFDLISLSHVLEHLPDPTGYLTTLRTTLLANEGHLLLEVPNLFGHLSFEVAHLAAYWPKTLHDTLRRAGFRVIYQKLHGVPANLSPVAYLTVIAVPDPDYAIDVGVVRRVGWWRMVQVRRLRWHITRLRRRKGGRSWLQFLLRGVSRLPSLLRSRSR